jgi:hypothetical protein
MLQAAIVILGLSILASVPGGIGYAGAAGDAPLPLLEKGHPVDWWFVFKFNSKFFPGCGANEQRECPFGGNIQNYTFSQQFVYASNETPHLQKGGGCVGETTTDPLGATFDEVYNNKYYYVIWNDQFYDDPAIAGCTKSCSSPWGHSKGLVAWNEEGEGLVLQVTTPSWPAAGSANFPRKTDGNTLGCITDDNVKVSQHFFSLRLTKDDLITVLEAIKNASVVTDPTNSQIVNNGGPADIQSLVASLGTKSHNSSLTKYTLSAGVGIISKPSALHVPPWQMVSAALDGVSLRAATWWASPQIYSTKANTKIKCWNDSLGKAGAVEIATSGQWGGQNFGLKGGPGPNFNHAKIGVSTSPNSHYSIFGDMNQQGTLSGKNCASSQNGRGGLFYVMDNEDLFNDLTNLIHGETAPTKVPKKVSR